MLLIVSFNFNLCTDLGLSLSPLSADQKAEFGSTKSRMPLVVDGKETKRMDTDGISKEMDEVDFDPGAQPPFRIAEIRAAIPEHCWVKNTWRSLSYVARDIAIVAGLIATAIHFNNWIVWPLYWAAQGTMFWAIFVLGHDW